MSDKVRTFCHSVHNRLATLDSHVRALTLNTGPTWNSLQEKLADLRRKSAARRLAVQQATDKLKRWNQEAESQTTISEWRDSRESRKLGDRAHQAEAHAVHAIEIVEASIDEAERMILEAISARLDESINRDSVPDSPNWYVSGGSSRDR